ncbi:MlaE family ABC transporter permease [Bradyrhizobium elkanii]|uniref:Phospholipid/cholesterol/gamma-HCH transport system permease protein n=1 Tax=Bradyrhizobium elkanii TaxID=29448 RepID=A0A8I1Y6R4_BRAEL|nr:ABC transporter permease [Bradyrhizobium elkanii]MBP1293757.1 phospholipid/cholesterol/gamma-HCH transport system permease protein [Bradyrhizobium elkanii]
MLNAPALIANANDPRVLTACGAWNVANVEALERLCAHAASTDIGSIDVRRVTALDTVGAWLLERLARGRATRAVLTGADGPYGDLLEEVRGLNRSGCAERRPVNPVLQKLDQLGRGSRRLASDSAAFLHMLGAFSLALLGIFRHPRSFRLTSTVYQLGRVGWQAVPIMVLITFLIGAIIAQQGIFHFRRFGAESYVVDMVGILVLREIGVLIVAIMVAGRSGSAYTAEIGAMKMREEIDALSTMGLDPVAVLILPRILALVVALPILAFLGSLAALYGGGLIAWLYGGMSPAIFIARLHDAVSVTHFEVGIIKARFMALVIGLVAAVEGLSVKGSAESLGQQTTASVVKSIFLVIVLDGLFAVFFASIGM